LFPLSNGKNGGVKLTIARFYTPLGNPIQGHGIKPDVPVEQLKNATIEKPKVNIREKDLARSLSAEKVDSPDPKEITVDGKGLKGKEQPALPPAPTPAGEKKEPYVLESRDKEEVIKDFQLLRAIETVKALHIYLQRPQK
jgi:carboxyl-terminal processing protease